MKVMVGLDESNGSLYALEWVISNILKPKQDTDQNQDLLVYLVHVNIPFQTYVYPAGPVVYTTSSVLESVRQAQDQISAGIFARAMDTCHKYEIKAEAISLRGDPKEEICQAADQKQVDLLVVGSRGLGMLKSVDRKAAKGIGRQTRTSSEKSLGVKRRTKTPYLLHGCRSVIF
ncbi:unnamed protein product [Amaranthus hypochondriacus]